uniref:HrcT n=1 Tax=Dickeya chrysanthemi TaxID=556 RepID=Q84BA6_DICCH|nr:HrcT [Dickeya chrysanthemi]
MLSIATIQNIYDFIYALTLGVARLYPCLFLVPLFSFSIIKGMLRNAVAIAIALVPAGAIQQQMLTTTITWPMLPALLLKELVIGLLLGVVLAMPFWLFESVGALFDNQRGALTGGQLNPALGSDATPLGHMLKELFIMLLVLTIGFSGFTQLLWDSYRLWPALDFLPRYRNGVSHLSRPAQRDLSAHDCVRRAAGGAAAAAGIQHRHSQSLQPATAGVCAVYTR